MIATVIDSTLICSRLNHLMHCLSCYNMINKVFFSSYCVICIRYRDMLSIACWPIRLVYTIQLLSILNNMCTNLLFQTVMKNDVFGTLVQNWFKYFFFHFLHDCREKGAHDLSQIVIFRKCIKGDSLRDEKWIGDFLAFLQSESSVELLIVKNSKAKYLEVFLYFTSTN